MAIRPPNPWAIDRRESSVRPASSVSPSHGPSSGAPQPAAREWSTSWARACSTAGLPGTFCTPMSAVKSTVPNASSTRRDGAPAASCASCAIPRAVSTRATTATAPGRCPRCCSSARSAASSATRSAGDSLLGSMTASTAGHTAAARSASRCPLSAALIRTHSRRPGARSTSAARTRSRASALRSGATASSRSRTRASPSTRSSLPRWEALSPRRNNADCGVPPQPASGWAVTSRRGRRRSGGRRCPRPRVRPAPAGTRGTPRRRPGRSACGTCRRRRRRA
ncbi:MAG: hypothetical protein JWR28_2205 [Modestobacter sp.]|nr:hypothetical protein [Modestobacter sp.]